MPILLNIHALMEPRNIILIILRNQPIIVNLENLDSLVAKALPRGLLPRQISHERARAYRLHNRASRRDDDALKLECKVW